MGFSAVGPAHFYASGHPGPGVGLPQPLGLVESTDGGRSWRPVSRQGESDFHALAAWRGGVVGYDGAALRASADGRPGAPSRRLRCRTRWPRPGRPAAAHDQPVRPRPLARRRCGLGGAARVPLLQVAAVVDAQRAVGVAPDGRVFTTADAGTTWTAAGSLGGPPNAVAAAPGTGRALRVVGVTAAGVLESRDGRPFAPLRTS